MLVAPYFIDWSVYRADFEREASAILGHPVKVRGDASARLLPFPTVTFSDVVVESEVPDQPLLAISRFRMDAELAPYLSGEIRIYSMRIERPRLRVPIASDGSSPWVKGNSQLSTSATIVLENVEITDGAVTIENGVADRMRVMTGIEARLSAHSLKGPFAGAGSLDTGQERLAFTVSTGVLQKDGRLPLKLALNSTVYDASLSLDGSATTNGALPAFNGTMRLASPLPKPAAGTAQPAATSAAKAPASGVLPPFALTSAVGADPRSVQLSDIKLAVGGGEKPYRLTGKGGLDLARLAHFSLDLEGEQVDVDSLASGQPTVPGAERVPQSLDARLAAARRIFAAVPRPTIPGTAHVTLPLVVVGDTTVRDVAFGVSPTDTGWSLQGFSAELPGRTRMEATGIVGLDDGLAFEGDLLVASRQPSGFADWLTGGVDPAIRALPHAGFSAKVDLSADQQVFKDLEIDAGGAALKGRLERSGPKGQRYTDAALSGGAVDLDAFLALSRLFTGEDDSLAETNFLSLKIAAGPMTYQGISAGKVDADLAYDGRRLKVDRLAVADLAGARLDVSGEITDPTREPSGQLDVALDAPNPKPLIDFLAARMPGSPALAALQSRAERLAPLALKGTLRTAEERAGERPTLQVNFSGSASGTQIGTTIALGNGIYAEGTSGRFGLDLALSSKQPAVLLGQLGLSTLPVPVPSPLQLRLNLSAGASGPVALSADARAPGTEATVEGQLDVLGGGLSGADVGLSLNSSDFAPWLDMTGATFGQTAQVPLPATMAVNLVWGGGELALNGLTARIGERDVSGALTMTPGGPLTGEMAVSDLSLPWLAGLVYGRSPIGSGPELWPQAAFGDPLLPPFDLSLDLKADRFGLGGAGAVSDFTAHAEIEPGVLRLSEIQGALAGGFVSGSVAMQNANGVGGFQVAADLSGIDLGEISLGAMAGETADGGGPQAPVAGALDARLSLGGSGQSYRALAAGLTGSGHVSVEDGNFAGLRRGIFQPLLLGADAKGFQATAPSVTKLLSRLTAGGHYPVASAASDIAVAGGIARFSPASVASKAETLTMGGAIDLRSAGVSADWRLDLDPGDDHVEGAAPSIGYRLEGPIKAPEVRFDVEQLTSYLSVRAYEREQARVEAIQEQLQERLRLRREARAQLWRDDQRARRASIAAEHDTLRLRLQEAKDAEEAARKAEILLREEEARRSEAARLAAEAALRAQAEAFEHSGENTGQGVAPSIQLPAPADVRPDPPTGGQARTTLPGIVPQSFPSLPGVQNPLDLR